MRVRSTCSGLLALVVVLAGVVVSSGAAADAAGSPGLLRVTTSPAVPSQITVDGQVADTWGLDWLKIEPGAHTVCFADVAGFQTPPCQSVTVSSGQTSTVEGEFIERGYVRVVTWPPAPSQISVDDVPRDNWSLYTDFPVGTHQVCFGVVAGLRAPACQSVTVSAGETSTVIGAFIPDPSATGLSGVGRLRVTTSPPVPSQVSVDGRIADTWGLDWLEIDPGAHTVCFADVAGFQTPACQSVTVAADATTNVTGSFVERGYLEVATSPAVASTISVDGVARDDWGVFTDFPVGSHEVCFGLVSGLVTPPCQTVSVAAGATTTVTSATFTPSTPPRAPTAVTATAQDASAVVTWWAPGSDGGSPVTGYTVTSTPGARTCATTGALTCTVTGLTNGTPYTFTVTATNDVGTSAPSSPSTAVTPAADAWTALPRPVGPQTWIPVGANDSGLVVGNAEFRLSSDVPSYCTGTCSTINSLIEPAGYFDVRVSGVSPTGVIYGHADQYLGRGIYFQRGVVWASATAEPTVLGGQSDYDDVTVSGVSSSGMIVGTFAGGGTQRGVVWASAGAAPTLLPNPAGYSEITVVGVSSSGMIVGRGRYASGFQRGVVWASATAEPTALSVPEGFGSVSVWGVSSAGVIYGTGNDGAGQHGLVWTSASGPPTRVIEPAGSHDVYVSGVSSSGVIYGYGYDAAGRHTLMWSSVSASPTVLSGPVGYSSVSVSGVSSSGAIVGYGRDAAGRHGLLWASASAVPTPLEPQLVTPVHVSGVSSSGVIYGSGYDANGPHGLVWASTSAAPTVLPSPAGIEYLWVSGVSSSGAIVGYGRDADNKSHGLVWSSVSAAPAELPNPDGYRDLTILGVSSSGMIVGQGWDGSRGRGLVWASASEAPAVLPNPDGYVVWGVSSSGMVYGYGSDAGSPHGAVWTSASATPTLLPSPVGYRDVYVTGVSSSGVIYGWGTGADYLPHGVMWASSSEAPAVLPNPGGFTSVSVSGVSSSGAIVGYGEDITGLHIVVWPSASATPTIIEPPQSTTEIEAAGENGTLVARVWSAAGPDQHYVVKR